MIPKKELALDSLTRVCTEAMNLINELIKCDESAYQKGYEDGMRAALNVQKTIEELNETGERNNG
jgi:hypothetical protein